MKLKSKDIAYAAISAAAYAALTFAIAPIAYGPIQLRLTEALCILPFFFPVTAWGLFVGCAISNLMSAAGLPDVIFGSLATLIAAFLTARIGKPFRDGEDIDKSFSFFRCVAACSMPIIVNVPIVGAVLAYMYSAPGSFWTTFVFFMGEIALGETAVMLTLGLAFMRLLPRLEIIKQIPERRER